MTALVPTTLRFELGGTRVTVHLLSLSAMVWAVFAGWWREMLLVLGALATHEMAHYLALTGYGMTVTQIELLPLGARMEIVGMSGRPDAETGIAVAGPVNNFILLALGLLLASVGVGGGYWWDLFLQINLALAMLNLLPALPFDGGRIVRGYLAETVGVAEASRLMTNWGVVWGIILTGISAYLALCHHIYLWWPAGAGVILVITAIEYSADIPANSLGNLFRREERMRGRPPPPIEHVSAYEHETPHAVSRRLGSCGFAIIWVLDEDLHLLGTLTEEELRRAVTAGRASSQLEDLLRRQ